MSSASADGLSFVPPTVGFYAQSAIDLTLFAIANRRMVIPQQSLSGAWARP